MRSPEGTPVGTMKRILISDINVWNADSRYASIISGVPGACIEDVTFRNIHLYYKGGYSEEDGKRIPPEQEKVYPEPWMFGTIPAKGFISATHGTLPSTASASTLNSRTDDRFL